MAYEQRGERDYGGSGGGGGGGGGQGGGGYEGGGFGRGRGRRELLANLILHFDPSCIASVCLHLPSFASSYLTLTDGLLCHLDSPLRLCLHLL